MTYSWWWKESDPKSRWLFRCWRYTWTPRRPSGSDPWSSGRTFCSGSRWSNVRPFRQRSYRPWTRIRFQLRSASRQPRRIAWPRYSLGRSRPTSMYEWSWLDLDRWEWCEYFWCRVFKLESTERKKILVEFFFLSAILVRETKGASFGRSSSNLSISSFRSGVSLLMSEKKKKKLSKKTNKNKNVFVYVHLLINQCLVSDMIISKFNHVRWRWNWWRWRCNMQRIQILGPLWIRSNYSEKNLTHWKSKRWKSTKNNLLKVCDWYT